MYNVHVHVPYEKQQYVKKMNHFLYVLSEIYTTCVRTWLCMSVEYFHLYGGVILYSD